MSNNVINYSKLYMLGANDPTVKLEDRQGVIDKIKSYPAVSVRGHRDELIEFVEEDGKPPLKWREQILEQMTEDELRILRRFIENRIDSQSRVN